MKIVAIVVTYNRKECLLKNIQALLDQTDAKADILIVDNASTDGTEEAVASYLNAGQIIYENTGENLGGAGGFNYGVQRAWELGYDIFWLMDDDVYPYPDTLSKLIQAHEDLHGDYGYLASVVLWKDGTECRMNKLHPKKYGAGPNECFKRIDFSTFVSMFLPRQTVEEFGLPIKEFFIWGDDIEYTRRITAKKPAYMVPDSKVLHDTKNNEGFNIAYDDGDLTRYRYAYRNEMFSAKKEGKKRVFRQRLRIWKHIARVILSSKGRKREKIRLIREATLEGRSFHPEIEYVVPVASSRTDKKGFQGSNNNKKLNIAMIGQKRIPSREGGVEVVVEELSTRMVARGHCVTCFNRRGHHVSGEEFDREKMGEYKGVRLKTVFTIDRKGMAAFTSSFSASVRAALGKYDIVHFHAEGPCCFLWIPKLFRKRCIATVHGIDWQREKWQGSFGTTVIHWGEKTAVRRADEIIVLSKGLKKYFKDTYNRDTVFIPNGVNKPESKDAKEITEKFGLHKDDYILFLGRIVPEKGLKYLIEAYRKLDTDKKLVIAGGSSDSIDYVNKIKSFCEDDKQIIFTDFVEGSILDELYSNAYIYCLPSDLEGMPLSLLEAMSYGNCCLVSDITENKEVVEDKAIVFHQGDISDLEKKLQMLCDSPDLVKQFKDVSSDYICQKYNWDSVVEQTLELYQREGPEKTFK